MGYGAEEAAEKYFIKLKTGKENSTLKIQLGFRQILSEVDCDKSFYCQVKVL